MPGPPESTRALLAAVLAAEPDGAPSLLTVDGDRLALRDGAVLGRGRGADLRLRDGLASRRHARFTRAGARWCVQDLGSKNGLRVNGCLAAARGVLLSPGDRVAVGDSLLLFEPPAPPPRALTTGATPGSAPAAGPRQRPTHQRPAILLAAALLACAAALVAVAG